MLGLLFFVRGLSVVAASGGHSSSRCAGLSLSRPLLLRSTGSRRAGSVIVAHGPSCSTACGIFPDQGSNVPCIGRQILNHCATREAPVFFFLKLTLTSSETDFFFFQKYLYVMFIDIFSQSIFTEYQPFI